MSSFDAGVETDASSITQRLIDTANRLRAVRAARRRFLFLWAIESDVEVHGGRFDATLRGAAESNDN